jgi:hypothetical protein
MSKFSHNNMMAFVPTAHTQMTPFFFSILYAHTHPLRTQQTMSAPSSSQERVVALSSEEDFNSYLPKPLPPPLLTRLTISAPAFSHKWLWLSLQRSAAIILTRSLPKSITPVHYRHQPHLTSTSFYDLCRRVVSSQSLNLKFANIIPPPINTWLTISAPSWSRQAFLTFS